MQDRNDTAGWRKSIADTHQSNGFGTDQGPLHGKGTGPPRTIGPDQRRAPTPVQVEESDGVNGLDRAATGTSEHRFRRLFEGMPIGIGILGETLRFHEVNRAMADMLGYSEAELAGRSIHEITHPDDLDLTARFLDQMELPGTVSRQIEKRYIRKDGQTIYVKVTALAIKDESEEIMFAVGIVEDVTEKRKFEAAWREAREAEAARQVEQARLEGVLLTVRESAHQIGNALNQAQGFTELTLLRNDLSPEARQMLDLAMEGLGSVTTYLHSLQRVVRVATKSTPAGPSLDVERSV